ncbi:RNA-binding protein 33-like isoform X1 [Formica exsecta]|uniref:RNA-binding protein 33-like isoform X1 n=1 Tax=Formica exsecta TaxID=72781 RepID=UPI0011427E28|nr:RNA-binding protein 33-like isoform X1 [Formica exsecta]
MSEHDDTLLDEDLGDEEYDLGNDEEEALLADDYEIERQNSYKGEEETDDVLDLGVTDALDDLDGEDENIEFSRGNTDKHSDNDFYKDGEHPIQPTSSYYEQDEGAEQYANEQASRQSGKNLESNNVNVSNNIGKGDLREKLQRNMQKTVYIGNGQGMEDDDCEEAKERRNRFQNERTMISPKMNNDIPETLESVVTSEPSRAPFRGRGRGRGVRGSRGGRFNVQNTGNFNPRFGTARPANFDNQPPACRPPLIETRPPCLLGIPSNVPNQQQIMYQQQANPQQPFQQSFGPNGPLQGPPAQFAENRPQFSPGQFQGSMGPRPISSQRLPEYGLRSPLAGGSMQGPSYNCPPNQQPPYHPPMQPPPFPNPGGVMQENRPGVQGNQGGPLLQGNPGGGSLLGNPNCLLLPGNPPNMLLPSGGNLPVSMGQGFPRQQQALPSASQGPPIQNLPPNVQMSSQPPPFENRLPPPQFQEHQFEGRNAYDARVGFHPSDQVPNSQFNNTMQPVPQQSASNISHSVSLPPGHKILINPHFRGTVQPANDTRLVWDSNQQQAQPQVTHSGQFSQPPSSYQNQGPYNQAQQGSSQYQLNYQQNKSDDPYAYFSDVWQENRPQKLQNSPNKHYPSDNNYSRESSYSDGNKYKLNSQWEQKDSYQEDYRGSHQNYRERDLPLRARNDHTQRSRTPSNTYRGDSYDQVHNLKFSRPANIASRGANRPPQKRLSESSDKGPREVSPKRNKPSNRNLQEVRRVDTASETVAEKEEDNDPEMQEYRKKMEEQKRLREKILREKENRRKMAAMEKQNEDVKIDSNAAVTESTQQEIKPASALMGIVKDGVKTRPGVAKGRGRPTNIQNTEAADRPSNMRIVRTIPTIQTNDLSDTIGSKDNNSGYATNQAGDIVQMRQVIQQSGMRRVVIQKPLLNSQKIIATTIQKTVSNLQKNQGLQQKVVPNTQVMQTQKIVQNQVNALQKSGIVGPKTTNIGQRMITHKTPGTLQKTVINDSANVHGQKVMNTQQNPQRIVLQKSAVQAKKLPEIKTNTVKLENLAASTSEAQIRRMCQTIGTIESIRMGEGNATIVFKTQSAAMVFHKKYQRKMLDLSLITVRLVPQSTLANKVVTATAKKS